MMTNEKAIDLLDNLIGMVEDNQESDYDTALKMGKQALKQNESAEKWYKLFVKKLYEQEPCEVSEYDKDHIWYKGKQYISLRRFLEVKAEKEPCDDAVSRDAAINIASLHCLTIDESVKALERLPSVTQKSGRWISLENRFDLGDRVKCSECGQVFVVGDDVSRNYCPNCGAKMESENKDL